ncbi:TRAP transporter TAXI family solute receptor [Constrictibacter sp. MBR-5]|jgi:TRAP transporter TAXI family solute receptor|uniref:TAXI family TRAP transporter solute-binding subunit n=1 Tax=Constrictibacter sp. MBR-5 TaxID=3156467 RepID=UPI00339972F1
MMRTLLAAIAAMLIAGQFTSRIGQAQDLSFFRIASGSAGGTYFPVAGMLAQAISNPPGSTACDKGGSCGVPGLIGIAQSAQGSVANVASIDAGQVESALAQSDVAYWAATGTGVFDRKPPLAKLRGIASLYPEHVHAVATAGSGVKSLKDLKGKRIGVGLPGSGVLVDARIVLEAAGLKEKTGYKPSYLNSADTMAKLVDGSLDAMVTVTGYPQSAVSRLAETAGAKLVPIEGKIRDRILAENPFFAAGVIPAGTYAGVDTDTQTVVVMALWLTSADQPEERIYRITQALWSETTAVLLKSGHAAARSIHRETALDGMSIDLHPGAARYYREAGLLE